MKATFRPSNSAWTPVQSPAQALAAKRRGGSDLVGFDPHALPAYSLADVMSKRKGWGDTHLLHAGSLDRERHMRMAGMSNEHIAEWGQDTWDMAVNMRRQRGAHPRGGSYNTTLRTPRFDNRYED